MPDLKALIQEGRDNGHSDTAILQKLYPMYSDKIDSARAEGHPDNDILDYIAAHPGTRGFLPVTGKNLTEAGVGTLKLASRLLNPHETLGAVKDLAVGLSHPIKQYMIDDDQTDTLTRLANTGMAYMGGNPDMARRRISAGDEGGAAAELLSLPILGTIAGAATARARKPNLPTRKSTEASASLIDPRAISSTFDLSKIGDAATVPLPAVRDIGKGIAAVLQPLDQQAAMELGITARAFPKREGFTPQSDIVGNVGRGADDALRIADRTVDIAQRPLDASILAYGDRITPGVQKAVVQDLAAKAAEYANLDPQLASAINGVIKNVNSRGGTVAGLNELKVHANKEVSNLLTAPQAKQIAASAQSTYAYHLLANSIRRHLYPEIERLGGPNLSQYGAREAAAIMRRNGIASTFYNEIAPSQARNSTLKYFDYVFQGSLYKSHVIRRAFNLEPSPMGQFNEAFRTGMGEFGRKVKSYSPERVVLEEMAAPNIRGLLTSGEPYKFSIPISEVGEGAFSTKVTLPQASTKEYLGSRTVPNANYTPVQPKPPASGTSHFTQRQQYGVAAETIPNRVRGEMSPARRRMDQLQTSSTAIPERSFTGPETLGASNWQYIAPTEGAALDIAKGGILTTTSPEAARTALNGMKARLQEGGLPPSAAKEFTDAVRTLEAQLAEYDAMMRQSMTTQLPPKVKVKVEKGSQGTVRKGGSVRKGAAAITGLRTGRDSNQR